MRSPQTNSMPRKDFFEVTFSVSQYSFPIFKGLRIILHIFFCDLKLP